MNLRKVSFFFIVTALIAVLAACGNDNDNAGNESSNEVGTIEFPELDRSDLEGVVAQFDGGEITGDEFATYLGVYAFLNPNVPVNDEEFRKNVINELVMEKIILEKVGNDNEAAKEQTDALWEQIEIIYTDEVLKDAYETLQLSEEEIRDTLTRLFTVDDYFKEQVTEEEIKELYEEAKPQFTTATFTHILVGLDEINEEGERVKIRTEEEALEKANDLYEQLMDGADMNELATEHTDDPGSADTGGTYENSPISQLAPEFRDAILEQEIDEIGEPVKTDFGYHIIRVEDLQVTPLEDLRELIVSQLAAEKKYDYLMNEIPEATLNF